MIILIVQEEDLPNFGYVGNEEDVPPGVRVWGRLDTEDWTLALEDGTVIPYGSFEELHQDLGETMMNIPAGPREALHAKRHGLETENVTDFAEQWGEMGARVLESIRRTDRRQEPGQ